MEYLDYEGLKYYHELLKDKLSKIKTEAVSESTYLPGDNITIENNVISAEIPEYQAGDNIVITDGVISAVIPEPESEHDFTKTASSAKSSQDNKVYFTTDTREIYKNGVSYGGSISAETSTTLPTETLSNKVLKDTASNTKFYPVTHANAVVGLHASVEANFVTKNTYSEDVEKYKLDQIVVAGALNSLNDQNVEMSENLANVQSNVLNIQTDVQNLIENQVKIAEQVTIINQKIEWQDE